MIIKFEDLLELTRSEINSIATRAALTSVVPTRPRLVRPARTPRHGRRLHGRDTRHGALVLNALFCMQPMTSPKGCQLRGTSDADGEKNREGGKERGRKFKDMPGEGRGGAPARD
ncbi:hypothetical protein EVAR_11001_1 [Eumeta japonica]|uniref:Uncharacterized protein n=1 Tax=Eumeta variegata TaxID=151549 RepID=A0A4C1YMN9_EUMVA|nr:hypothetical protein EVAR_11001_1 [Eumeta japonica]